MKVLSDGTTSYTVDELRAIAHYLELPVKDLDTNLLHVLLENYKKHLFQQEEVIPKLVITNLNFTKLIDDKFYSPAPPQYAATATDAYLPLVKRFSSTANSRAKIGGIPFVKKYDQLPVVDNIPCVFLVQFYEPHHNNLLQIYINPLYNDYWEPEKIIILRRYNKEDLKDPEDDETVKDMLEAQELSLETHQEIVGTALIAIFNTMVARGIYKTVLFEKEKYTLSNEYRIVKWLLLSEYLKDEDDEDGILNCFKISGYPYSCQTFEDQYHKVSLYNNFLIAQWGDDGALHIDNTYRVYGDMC